MEAFLKFLQASKTAISNFKSFESLHIVLGNESCDLDSTISALALAYLLYSLKNPEISTHMVVPVMNTEEKYFHLRTETVYLLKKYGIDFKNFVFKDQIQYEKLLECCKITTSLVDHHVLSANDKILEKTVVEIFDHRPINTKEICNTENLKKKVIKVVGSCSTLISIEIIDSKLPILFDELCHLLYATIIYDTIGLNKDFGKTFAEDISTAATLEKKLKKTIKPKELFDLLWKIHNDTSSLTTKDLLYRDLKIVHGIPIPGLPLLVEDYLKRPDADGAVSIFAKENNTTTVVLIGIDASKDVKRDIAIYSTNPKIANSLINILKNNPDLSLDAVSVPNKNFTCFRQGNIKLTRKYILPLINSVQIEN